MKQNSHHRYYNSWIETSEEVAESDSSTTACESSDSQFPDRSFTPVRSRKSSPPARAQLKNSLGLSDNFENLAPAEVTVAKACYFSKLSVVLYLLQLLYARVFDTKT